AQRAEYSSSLLARRCPSEGRRILARMTDDLPAFFAHQKTVQIVHGVVIRSRLSLKGPAVSVVHTELDPELPERSVRGTAGEHELLLLSADWADRQSERAGYVQQWMMEHIDLRAATPRKAARRYDETWMTAWRAANPRGH